MNTRIKAGDIRGGEKSRAAFARLCGLSRAGNAKTWRLEAVRGGAEGRVRLSFGRGGNQAVVILKPAPSKEYYLRAGALDICYEGKVADKPLANLLETLARRLKGRKPEELMKILARDARAAREEPRGGADPDAQCVSDRLGGNPGQWRRFFCEREFGRMFFWAHPTGFVGRVLYLVHGDFDCTFMPPDVTFRGMSFLNYPPVHPHSQDAPLPDTAYEQWTTDLREKDVVLGTADKLDAFLRDLRDRSRPDLVMISWSCTPTVIGDDEKAMASKCKEAGKCPVVMNSINFRMKESFSLFEEIFKDVRSEPRFLKTAADPGAVNLLDCPSRFFDEELSGLFAAADIRVNARVFPRVHIPSLHRYLAAAAQVIPEYLRHIPTVRRAVDDLPLETVYAPAPFGIEGARAYVRALARPLGKEEAADRLWAGQWRRHEGRWRELAREARKYRLAFVADETNLRLLLRPEFLTGIPVVRMIAEMGFSADFLVYAPEGELPEAANALETLPGFRKPPAVRPFRNPQELDRALTEGSFGAVYSDIFFDHRITRAGKAQFSMRAFEAGAQGALRSLERLLGACRLPFYRRYRRQLRRIPRGVDV